MQRLPAKASRLALVYHGVAEVGLRNDPHALFVSPKVLSKHIAVLRRWGYSFATFSDLASHAANGSSGKVAALTFDDGLVDNLETLAPLLEKEGIPATVFVVSGWLGQSHPDAPGAKIMNATQVADLSRAGIEIGAHTVSHPDLTALEPKEALRELVRSRHDLQEIIGREVTTAAYPYGYANPATISAAEEAGFTWACRASGQGSWLEPLNLPRQDMSNSGSRLGLWLKQRDLYEPFMATTVGRATRRLRRIGLGALGR